MKQATIEIKPGEARVQMTTGAPNMREGWVSVHRQYFEPENGNWWTEIEEGTSFPLTLLENFMKMLDS